MSEGARVRKRSVAIAGHRTSVSLETPFWEALRDLAEARGRSVQALMAEIDAGRGRANLSSAVRVFVLERARAGELRAAAGRPAASASGAPA